MHDDVADVDVGLQLLARGPAFDGQTVGAAVPGESSDRYPADLFVNHGRKRRLLDEFCLEQGANDGGVLTGLQKEADVVGVFATDHVSFHEP